MISKQQLQSELGGYCGSVEGHILGLDPIHKNIMLTDGALYLANAAECFWLMDIIMSVTLMNKVVSRESFCVWRLNVSPDMSAVVIADDGDGNVVYTQNIDYTDFPLDTIKLYCAWATETKRIIMLPNEY